MCITYEVETGLYINMTNRCSNKCEFCIRNNGDGAYGSDSLWLEREPTVDEVLDSVFARDLGDYSEIVFCGYGEPTYRLSEMREVALRIKEKYPAMPIRVNTNGHSDLINGRNTAAEFKDAFDCVSISLNTPSAKRYDAICHPRFGERSHSALVDFASRVREFVPSVAFSVVGDFLTAEEIDECYAIAKNAGVPLKVRKYIG